MDWKVFAEIPPPDDKWQRYHVTLASGEVGTATYSCNSGFYDIDISGEKKPTGTVIHLWALIQEQ